MRSRSVRAFLAPVLTLVVLVSGLLVACDDGGDGTTREVGSAALLGFDSGNVTAIALAIDDTGAAPLRVYVGPAGGEGLHLPEGRHLLAVVTPFGDLDDELVTVSDPAGEDVIVQAPAGEDSPTDRDEQRSAAVALVDFALIFKLGMLEIEQALTDDFTRSLDDPAYEVSEEAYDSYLEIMNGLSAYEPDVEAAISRLFRDSENSELLVGLRPGGRVFSFPSSRTAPNAGVLDSIKDFFNNNGKSANDERARDTLLRNTENLTPDQQQQVFDDLKNGTKGNRNVENAGGISETNAKDFFENLQKGKYDKIAQDLEKGARQNPDYTSQLQENKDTPTERGKRDGGKALKDGAKVVEDSIKAGLPGDADKILGPGEKINDLLDSKPKPTETPVQPTPRSRLTPVVTPPTQPPADTVVPQPTVRTPQQATATVPPAAATPPATVPPPPTIPPTTPPTVPPTVPPTIPPTVPPPTAPPATAPPQTAPTATVVPLTSPPATVGPAGTVVAPTIRVGATTAPEPTTTPRVPINEITGLKVVLIKLGSGDAQGTTSHEIDVVVTTIVRTRPAAMVNCTTPYGTGHNIGSSSLYPGEKFTIPLHREDLYGGSTVSVTCTIREGNTMSGSAKVPGKCAVPAAGSISFSLQDPCEPPTLTPQASATAERSPSPEASASPAVSVTADDAGPSTTPVRAVATATVPPAATATVRAAATPTVVPTHTPPATIPPLPTSTAVPVATPTFTPTVIDGFFWPGDVFAVETVPLPAGHDIVICLSGTMYLEEGDFGPAEMATVNGIVPNPCVSLIGDGQSAIIQCGHGTPLEEPGGFNVVVTDYGP